MNNTFISSRPTSQEHALSHICRLNYTHHACVPAAPKNHNPSIINQLAKNRITFVQHPKSRNQTLKCSNHLFASPKLVKERSSPGDLASSETVQARVVAVVHPVVDGVDAAAGAGVLADGAARGRDALGRGVGDGVASAGAAALEDVVETEVVADLVDGGGTLVEASGGAAGEGVGEVDAAVEELVAGGGVGDGEVAPVLLVRGASF